MASGRKNNQGCVHKMLSAPRHKTLSASKNRAPSNPSHKTFNALSHKTLSTPSHLISLTDTLKIQLRREWKEKD